MKRLGCLLMLLMLLVGGTGAWYWHKNRPPLVRYHQVSVKRGDLLLTASATGTLDAEEVVDVGTRVSGMVQAPDSSGRLADSGALVEKGTILARIDDTLFRAQVAQARANLLKAKADRDQLAAKLRLAEQDLRRAEKLRPSGGMARNEYDMYRANHEAARYSLASGEAAVEQVQRALEEAEINLGYTTIRSPVKGSIIERRVNVGQTVASSPTPSLFLIARDLSHMEIRGSVNEADIGRIRLGMPVTFKVDAFPDKIFKGTVIQKPLNASTVQQIVTYPVKVAVDNRDGLLMPYMTANVHFHIERRSNVLQVPNMALQWRPRPEMVAPDARDHYRQIQEALDAERGAEGTELAAQQRGLLWVADGPFVRPVVVRTGLSDGSFTEITEVEEGQLEEGDKVVDEDQKPEGEDMVTPFLPRVGGRKPS